MTNSFKIILLCVYSFLSFPLKLEAWFWFCRSKLIWRMQH